MHKRSNVLDMQLRQDQCLSFVTRSVANLAWVLLVEVSAIIGLPHTKLSYRT
jgi:hypothetical protein